MPSRPILTSAFALVVFLAGCLGAGVPAATTDSPGTDVDRPSAYESYVFDHGGTDRPAIEGGLEYDSGEPGTSRFYAMLVTSREEVERFNDGVLDAEARAFVENTAFDEAYLVVVQAFPASSTPDYRVERVERAGDEVRVHINDSSPVGTADITVETVLVRIARDSADPPERAVITTEGDVSFTSGEIVTRTPAPTPTPGTVALPFTSSDPAENVDEPRDLRIENHGDEVNGYAVRVTYTEVPECRSYTPPCGEPERTVTLVSRTAKLRPGKVVTIADVAVKTGTYTVTVDAMVPGANDSRRTIRETVEWPVDDRHGDAVIRITDDAVNVTIGAPPA